MLRSQIQMRILPQHLILPAAVGFRPRFRERGDPHALNRIPIAELPGQLITIDETTEARVKRRHVVILEVHLNKSFPVVVTFMRYDFVQLVARKIKRRSQLHARQIFLNITPPLEKQAIPVL